MLMLASTVYSYGYSNIFFMHTVLMKVTCIVLEKDIEFTACFSFCVTLKMKKELLLWVGDAGCCFIHGKQL